MPSYIYKLTITTSDRDGLIETITEIYSTLLSANRAAYRHHKERKPEEGYEYQEPVKNVNWDAAYSARFKEDEYIESKIVVEECEVWGPDLSRGEVDEEQSSWEMTAGLDEEEDDEDDEDDEGEDDEDDGADSSEVEIIEPPAKRARLDVDSEKSKD